MFHFLPTLIMVVIHAGGINHFDPAWIVAIGAVVGSLGWIVQVMIEHHKQSIKNKVEPEKALAEAYTTSVQGFDTLIRTLHQEVARLQEHVNHLEGELATTTRRLLEVQADLALNVTENRRLRAELSKMRDTIAALDNKPDH